MVDNTKLKEYHTKITKLIHDNYLERMEHKRIKECIDYLFQEKYDLNDDGKPKYEEDGQRTMIPTIPIDSRTGQELTETELEILAEKLLPTIETHLTKYN